MKNHNVEELNEIYNSIKVAVEKLDKINCRTKDCEGCMFKNLSTLGCGDLISEFK